MGFLDVEADCSDCLHGLIENSGARPQSAALFGFLAGIGA